MMDSNPLQAKSLRRDAAIVRSTGGFTAPLIVLYDRRVAFSQNKV
jgi:hypothetical protein